MQTNLYRILRDLELPLEFRLAALSRELESAWNTLSHSLPDVLRPRAETRPHTTLLVTDLVDFSGLVESLGDDAARALMQQHNRILRASLRAAGGREVDHTGDGVIAAFTSTDAAISCACDIQHRLRLFRQSPSGADLRVRIGLHAGHPLPEEGRLFGSAVIAAVRICSVSAADAILVSDVVRELARREYDYADSGVFQLKGLSEPRRLHRVCWWNLPQRV
jgi:class 3 adenylate cyclase